jgi:putative membrane protein
VSICLAISAAYELMEWRVSVATGSAGDAFLGTQGDVWDTQEDMATALVAALIAPLLLGRLHDRQLGQLARLEAGPEPLGSR